MPDRPPAPRASTPTILLSALAVAVLFCNLGNPLGLHQNDEDRWMAIVQTMLASGDWVAPSIGGDHAFDKPPLLFWMMAASMRLFGVGTLAARLPAALCGVALVLLTASVARRYAPPAAAWLGGAVVATSFGLFQYGRAAMTDVPLALGLLVSLLGLRQWADGRAAGPYVAAAGAALGTMAKSPVAALIAAGAGLAWWAVSVRPRHDRPTVPTRHLAGAAVLAVVIAGAWPLALWTRGLGAEWFRTFVVGEHLGKFAGGRDTAAGMIGGFAGLLAPWTLIAAAALWRAARERAWRDADVMLPLAFIGANLAVFCVPAIKWPHYLLPSLPMLGLVTAWAVRDAADRSLRVAGSLTAAATAAGAGALLAAFRLFPSLPDRVLMSLMAASWLAAAWFFLNARSLPRAAAAAGCSLVVLALLAPRLTLDRLPGNLAALTAGRELMTYGHPPHRYLAALGRDVGVTDRPLGFTQALERGAMVIVGDGDRRALVRGGATDPTRTADVACWTRWRPALAPADIWQALRRGDASDLEERVCVVERR